MRRSILTLTGGLALAVVAGLALACRDDTTGPGAHAVTTVPQPQANVTGAHDPRADLQKANPMNWVGASHNAALDAFVKEVRKPGVLTRDVCSYLVEFSVRDERIPAARRQLAARIKPPARRDVAAKALRAAGLCGATRSSSASMRGEPAPHDAATARPAREALAKLAALPASRASRAQSHAAYNLLSQIGTAMDYAVDPYDLAARLRPILDAAASLSYEEYATIAATISVAQSSFEYWQAQLPAFLQATAAEYKPCADQMRWAGYSYDYAKDQCLGSGYSPGGGGGGGYGGADWRFGPEEQHHRAMAAFILTAGPTKALRQCPGKADGFRRIGRADLQGAFTGGFTGAISAGLQGAILGALLGGSGVSIATALGLAWQTAWYC